jgi:flagellar basal-body rod protein FlgB
MTMTQMPLLAALADKMRWHQARQTILAENVANADTPGFRPSDLKAYSFEEHLRSAALETVATSATEPMHFSVSSGNAAAGFDARTGGDFEITPSGNAVSLEDEMMKVSANQMDYQAITSLYSRSLRLLRTALGRQA